jgi:REP element-mobilizing transposase RayT
MGLLPHLTRERHRPYEPVHVTVRAVRSAPNLRSQVVFAALRAIFARSSTKGFRLLHFSVQGNHMHLIAEADDGIAFARGVQRLLSRAAMAINALARRSGSVWRDRHHREPLTTPSQVRNTYAYVLFNDRKHEMAGGWPSDATLATLDDCSSAQWFRDWSPGSAAPLVSLERAGPPILAAPRSWLADKGWKTWGLLRFDEIPYARPRASKRRVVATKH